MTIKFLFNEIKAPLSERMRLKQYLKTITNRYKKPINSLSYIFCSDKFLSEINRKFLKKNYYTDIITFNLSESDSWIDGEVYISIDRVRENAVNHGVSVNNELHRVIFHGLLHLCGLDDKSAKEEKLMRDEENKCLKEYFL